MTKDRLRKMMGESIRNERVARNLSIDELAELIGLTPGFVGLIERGKRGATALTLYNLSKIMDLPVDQLFQDPTGVSLKMAEDDPVAAKRTKLYTIAHDLNECELDFLVSVIKNLKTMSNAMNGKAAPKDDGADEDEDETTDVKY